MRAFLNLVRSMRSVRFVYGRLGNLQITANLRHWCKSISVLPVFSVSPVNVQEAHEYMRAIQPMKYEFELHCCDVIALCILHRRLQIYTVLYTILSP